MWVCDDERCLHLVYCGEKDVLNVLNPGEAEGDLMGEGPTDDDIGVKGEDPIAETPLLPPGVKS